MKGHLLATASLFVLACEGKPAPAPPAEPSPNTTGAPGRFDLEPPPARLALPAQVLAMRLPAGPAGTYWDQELAQPVPLRAVGLNQCQTGWMLQGYLDRDGKLSATPPLLIRYGTLPLGPAESRDPAIADQAIVLELAEASMERLRGTVRITDAAGGDVMRMTIDTTPVGIASGPGLGGQGCFTTGYFEAAQGDARQVGPVAGVWDQKRLHYLGLRLDERHGVGIWLYLEPTHRQPQNVIRGDLHAVADRPTRFPFRVVFETRKTTADGFTIEETPATQGSLLAAFLKANPQGPVRVELADLAFPDWDGPLAGVTLERLRVESLLVTDPDGAGVPVPSTPHFEAQWRVAQERVQRPEAPPDAAPRVSPAQRD